MANLRKWSQTATGNASVAGGTNTINFAEGQTPGSVNNSAREMMAQIRGVYTPDNWGWVEHSATASVVNQTSFKISGDQTSNWTAGRRWRLKSGSSTRYGAIVSASYTTETTVTVTVDSGSLSASHTLAAVAAIDSNHIPANGTYVTSASLATALGPYVTSSSLSTALSPYITSNSVSAAIANYVTSNSVSVMIAASTRGVTSLGTITTTSGTSQSLGSLTLTNYKFVRLVFNGVSGTTTGAISVGSLALASQVNTDTTYGVLDIDLSNGVGGGAVGPSATNINVRVGATGYSTATTTITVTIAAGTFDAGSIAVYGIA